MTKEKKLWGGRFEKEALPILERIGESISFDKALYKVDIQGSKAHSKNLLEIGILTQEEYEKILSGLDQIQNEIENGSFEFTSKLEDIHMHIENKLTQIIGETGKKLHTGRSRNDQVALDVRLFIREAIQEISKQIFHLLEVLLKRAEESIDIIMPGYTHLQVAQPIRASHYLLSYFWAFLRDYKQFLFALSVNDSLVLGSGALAGVNYKTNRELIQKELNFSRISENSIDAVSQRDHILNFLFAASLIFTHFSRLCEEIILYSSVEFGFISLPDSLTTGSSIMPQKKNPDIAELIRGKSARIISHLNHLFILLKGLPLAYNRDLQEDKIPLFDTVEQLKISIEGITEMLKNFSFHPERMENSLKQGFATATDLADHLVTFYKVPFRQAHELVGKLVSLAVQKQKTLFDLSVEERKEIHEYFTNTDYFSAISLQNSADKKDVFGGTAKNRQIKQIQLAKKELREIYKPWEHL
ncbi:MAG: argininosuccinate lyase [Leptospiraceae bacterium]|nr:argininosuccinate lyase [Leptospiraceae bacterium]